MAQKVKKYPTLSKLLSGIREEEKDISDEINLYLRKDMTKKTLEKTRRYEPEKIRKEKIKIKNNSKQISKSKSPRKSKESDSEEAQAQSDSENLAKEENIIMKDEAFKESKYLF